MRIRFAREGASAVLLVALGAIGIGAPVTSMSGWLMLAAFGLIAIVAVQRIWRDPAKTLSESIQDARQ